MVAVVITPEIRAVLQSAGGGKGQVQTTKTEFLETISHTALRKAIQCSRKSSGNDSDDISASFTALIQATEIHLTHEDAVQVHIPKKRSEKLEARILELRRRLENDSYERMVRDVTRTEANNAQTENLRLKKLAPQMSLGFNVVVTMATCFTAAYFVFKNSSGSQTVGLIAGVAGMIVAMLVEVILLLSRLSSIDDAVRKERKDERKRRS